MPLPVPPHCTLRHTQKHMYIHTYAHTELTHLGVYDMTSFTHTHTLSQTHMYTHTNTQNMHTHTQTLTHSHALTLRHTQYLWDIKTTPSLPPLGRKTGLRWDWEKIQPQDIRANQAADCPQARGRKRRSETGEGREWGGREGEGRTKEERRERGREER